MALLCRCHGEMVLVLRPLLLKTIKISDGKGNLGFGSCPFATH